jgi:hypothetical protein
LMQVYRDGALTLEQLMAFAITEDHTRQEAVYERLSYDRDASTIRRLLTATHVAATDRRAVFVGVEAYTEAGGTILRDSPRIAAAISRMWRCLICWWQRSSAAKPMRCGRRGLEMDGSPSRLPARAPNAADLPASGGAFAGRSHVP